MKPPLQPDQNKRLPRQHNAAEAEANFFIPVAVTETHRAASQQAALIKAADPLNFVKHNALATPSGNGQKRVA